MANFFLPAGGPLPGLPAGTPNTIFFQGNYYTEYPGNSLPTPALAHGPPDPSPQGIVPQPPVVIGAISVTPLPTPSLGVDYWLLFEMLDGVGNFALVYRGMKRILSPEAQKTIRFLWNNTANNVGANRRGQLNLWFASVYWPFGNRTASVTFSAVGNVIFDVPVYPLATEFAVPDITGTAPSALLINSLPAVPNGWPTYGF